jgi:hypothetical protein
MDKKQCAMKIDEQAVASRLRDLAVFTVDGRVARAQKIYAVLEGLDPGVYLVGTGPYTQGVYSLMCDEVAIGRLATSVEQPSAEAVDIFVDDNATLTPREVSRLHCAIYRREGVGRYDYWIIDRKSTCGTFVNNERLEAPGSSEDDEIVRVSRELTNGDVISLGPSLINTFLFLDLSA